MDRVQARNTELIHSGRHTDVACQCDQSTFNYGCNHTRQKQTQARGSPLIHVCNTHDLQLIIT